MDNKKNIIILSVLFLIFSFIFFAKTGNFLIDFSRESYIPFQMIQGEKLLKDIFLIYGPFGYIINSLIYIFKVNLNLLIIEAHLISFLILILFYFIMNKFFTSKVSLVFSTIFLLVSIFSYSIFSFVLPYSYSTLWAVLGVYLVLFSLLYNKKNILFLSLGLILSSKIEYFIPSFLTSIIYLLYKKESFTKNIPYLLVFPFICVTYFTFSGISLDDICKNYYYIKATMKANSLKRLYKGMGVFFYDKYFNFNIILTLKIFCIFLLSHFLYIIKKPIISYIALIVLLCLTNINRSTNLIGFIAIFATFLTARKKQVSKEEWIFFIFALILSLKSFFAINMIGYGNFGCCLLVFYTFLQLQKFMNTKWLINAIILLFTLNFIYNIQLLLISEKKVIKTQAGNIILQKNDYELFEKTNLFIEKHVKKQENFIVLPEGQIFNLIHKKNHNFINSTFTPLDFETFQEKELIKQLQNNQTDFIIFYPRDTKEYGKQGICFDYAVDFCNYIMDNYTQVATFKSDKQVTIFKIKK